MFNYQTVRAMQEHRYIRPSDEARRDGEKPKRNHRRLEGLLRAVALWMAALGIRGQDGKNRPASPAY